MPFWDRIKYLFDFGDLDPDLGYIFPPLEPATKTASSGVTSGSGLSWDSLFGYLGSVGSAASGIASLFKSSSGGERSSDYTARMLNEFLQNPQRALSLYNKNTDLTNPFFQSLVKGMTGEGLTGSQLEMNHFNAEQAQLQRDWQEHMASTQFQRTTADMQAAGLNPALMYGGSASPASSGSGSAASGGTPSSTGIGAIAELIQAASQARLSRSASALNQSEAFKNIAEIRLINSKKVTEDTRPANIQASTESFKASAEQMRSAATLASEQAKTEEGRRYYIEMSSALNKASAEQIEALTPSIVALNEARTAAARASASLSLAHAAFQNGLLKRGMIEQIFQNIAADTYLKNKNAYRAYEEALEIIKRGYYTDEQRYYLSGKGSREEDLHEERWIRTLVDGIERIGSSYVLGTAKTPPANYIPYDPFSTSSSN